jgi:hypothetical protein
MPKSRRGRRRRRALIEGILITGAGVIFVAGIFVYVTSSMVYHGNGSRIRPPASVFTPRSIR